MKTRTRLRILVVQADRLSRRAVARHLRQTGHRVFEAATCQAGVRLAGTKQPDAIVLKMPLPDVKSLAACRKLKADPRAAGIPVLQISDVPSSSRQQLQSLKSGVDIFLLGPLTPRQVEEQVEALLRARRAEAQLRANQELLAGNLEELQAVRRHLGEQNTELEFQRQRYLQLFNLAPDAYLVTDLRGWIRDANLAACQLLQARRQLLVELPLRRFIGVLDWGKIKEMVAGLCQETPVTSRSIETHIRPRKGAERLCAVAVNLERNAAGEPVGLRWLLRDITEHRQTEDLLRSSEEHYRGLVNQLHDGIVVVDLSGRFVFANPACERISGYSVPELLQKNFAELCAPDQASRVQQLFEAYVREEGLPDVETAITRKDGERVEVLVSASRIVLGGRLVGVQCCAKDITWRKQAEGELREVKEALARINGELEQQVAERTAKLRQSVGELEHLAYAMAHDMRAPLRAMQGFAELLLARCGECKESRSRDFFRRMIGAAGRMDKLVTGVLNYSKAVVETFPLEAVDPFPLLQDMLETYPNLQPDKAKIQIEQPLARVKANEAALIQCFSQLLGNAVKFVPPDKTPWVRVWAERVGTAGAGPVGGKVQSEAASKCAGGPVESGVAAPGDGRAPCAPLVRFWFEDNGIGIPGDFQARLFAMFQQGTAECEGVGIGLALVRKLAERMGGRVGVESRAGEGSRFWLELQAG